MNMRRVNTRPAAPRAYKPYTDVLAAALDGDETGVREALAALEPRQLTALDNALRLSADMSGALHRQLWRTRRG